MSVFAFHVAAGLPDGARFRFAGQIMVKAAA
jgi:hypothetical protein